MMEQKSGLDSANSMWLEEEQITDGYCLRYA
jgi:hypothetical protein